MKAMVIHQYGSCEVLKYEDVEQPKIKSDQMLIKVYASSVNPVDWKIRKGMLSLITGNKFPMILGVDMSGEVVEVGAQVTSFQLGDEIYGNVGIPGGAYAEYAVINPKFVAKKPTNISHEEAAAIPVAALTSLQALRNQGNLQSGQKLLINGAVGGVGSYAVQIAKALGAEVTAVCSTKNLELAKSLGSDFTIDYTQQDFTLDPIQYDMIFDAVGKSSFSHCKAVLKPNGVYITTVPSPEIFIQTVFTAFLPGQKAKFIIESPNTQDLLYLNSLIETGKMRSLIDRTYSLQDLAQAHAYSESERAVGKIAIRSVTEGIAVV